MWHCVLRLRLPDFSKEISYVIKGLAFQELFDPEPESITVVPNVGN